MKKIIQRGDDLDDDFVADDLVALSGDELELDEDVQDNSQSDDYLEEAIESGSGSDTGSVDIGSIDGARPSYKPPADLADPATIEKKRKRKEKLKESKAKKRKLAEQIEPVEHTVASQPPLELSQYLVSMQTKTFPKMSAIELDDFRIPESSIADTTSWTGKRILDNLPQFIIEALPTLRTRLTQKSKSNGAPTVLFITGAALRVADVTRVMKDPKLRGEKGGEVAKLFAKHFKLAQHVSYLKRTKVGAAVGTPGRIGKLLCETDALTISALSHIILDITYRDSKKRSLLEIPETRDEVFKTVLGGEKVLEAIKAGKIQVVLF